MRAGVSVAIRTASGSGTPADRCIVRRQWSRPIAPEARAVPSVVTPTPSSFRTRSPLPSAPNQYTPSGMSTARIESVTRASRSGPFALYASRSNSGLRCLPSAITSVVSSSKYSVASISPARMGNVWACRSRARSDIAQNR